MQEAFININSVPTHIISWGPWIEESFSKKEVVILITGNPGLPGFYTTFLKSIHETIDPDIPVWVIGHAGHDEPPATSLRKVPPLRGNEDKYNLDAQVKHKLEFIETYVPNDVKVHLIGHSIGSWMIIEMLKRDPSFRNKYSRLTIMEQVLFLAREEMKRIVELDSATLETLRSNHQILKLYYGGNDGWTPLKYCHQLKQQIPELDLEIDNRGIHHAFVIKSSEVMGRLVGDWIMNRRSILF